MKRIRQLFYLFILISYVTVLGNCQSKKSNQDQIVLDFESELGRLLEKEEQISGEDYKYYLDGIKKMTIPRAFFTSAEKIQLASDFRASETFRSIWEKKSVIDKQRAKNNSEIIIAPPRTAGDDGSQQRPDYYQINLDSKYMNDLIEQTTNPEAKFFFKDLQKIGDIAPPIIADALIILDDFEDESVKKYIVLQFYYDFIFMINRMNSIDQK